MIIQIFFHHIFEIFLKHLRWYVNASHYLISMNPGLTVNDYSLTNPEVPIDNYYPNDKYTILRF